MIAVTGCAGYIGSMVCHELLSRGWSVKGFDNLYWGQSDVPRALSLGRQAGDFIFVKKDIKHLTREDIAGCHTVIHLAALVGAPLCDNLPDEQVFYVNAALTCRLVNMLSPSQRIIFANTNSGYGRSETVCTEDSPLTPLSSYAQSKVDGELYVLGHNRGVSLRLATVFGMSYRPRMDLLVNDFSLKLLQYRDKNGPPLKLFEPGFYRSAVHIRDVARAFAHMVENRTLNGVFNVADTSMEMTKGAMAGRIADILRCPHEAIVSGEGTDKDCRDYRVSSEKLLHGGFRFYRELADGVREIEAVAGFTPLEEMARWRNA